MKRRFRLRKSTDIQRVRRTGKSYAHPLVVLVKLAGEWECLRVGVVVGRRVGNAVVRNRTKRRIRACMQEQMPALEPGWDLLIVARPPAGLAAYKEICDALNSVLRRAGLLPVARLEGAADG